MSTDPSSLHNSGSAWSSLHVDATMMRPPGISTYGGYGAAGAAGAAAGAADGGGGARSTNPGTAGGGTGGAALAAAMAAEGSSAAAATAAATDHLPTRLAHNAAALRYLRQCHAEVLGSLRPAQAETMALRRRLEQTNARAQAEHGNLTRARSMLEDALCVNAHLREENDMIRTDDERWAFQVEQRTEQLESLTELLDKLERQQAAIDERKRVEEAEMVRRLEEERAGMVRRSMLAERGRGGGEGGSGSGGSAGGSGSSGAGGGAGAAVGGAAEGMPILPRGTHGAMGAMLALAPEWTPMSTTVTAGASSAAATGGGGGPRAAAAHGGGYHPADGGHPLWHHHQQQQHQQQQRATSLSEAIAIDGAEVGVGGNDAASTVSALTTDM